ncbi:MAG TPA: zinc-binding alcohol dehydrogenase family protein [Terriglobia bacterium]|nr:zinc-binding alcohol dehydrogenase family protein [Terriglobia bacterium]
MKALRFHQFGNSSVLHIEDVPRPTLQDGEVLVQIMASSINPSDVGTVAGRFHSQLPMTPGRDFAGIVVEGGGEWKGKHVWGTGAGFGVVRPGAHAEFVAMPSSWLSEKPDGLSMESAAAVGVPYLAAWESLIEAGGLQKGERLLITGGGGAVGSAATQIAHWKDATVLVADAGRESQEADLFINLREQDLVSTVHGATDGKGVDIVLDTVGANLFGSCLRSLRVGGRQIAIANNGPDPEVHLNLTDFYHNQFHLIGVDTQKLTGPRIADLMNHLREGFQVGHLRTSELETNPFDKAVEAYTKVAEKKTRTKQVLIPG